MTADDFRDTAAIAAMRELIARAYTTEDCEDGTHADAHLATRAFQIADAMVGRRGQKKRATAKAARR